ncbi:MAG: hypothetical protein LBT03_02430 [Holosporales bacterium]|jgi:hypothetical protein|nr:hypothetical protein [Holosporales bacterium]
MRMRVSEEPKRALAILLDFPEISGDIKEVEFDEMWHFIGSKKVRSRSSRPLS